MSAVFADPFYFLALLNDRDAAHIKAIESGSIGARSRRISNPASKEPARVSRIARWNFATNCITVGSIVGGITTSSS